MRIRTTYKNGALLAILITLATPSYFLLNASEKPKQLRHCAPQDWMSAQIDRDFLPFINGSLVFHRAEQIVEDSKIQPTYQGLMRVTYQNRHLLIRNWKNQCVNPGSDKSLFSGRLRHMHAAFCKLIKMHNLPEFDIVILLDDCEDSYPANHGPILCFSKRMTSDHCIMIPDFEALGGNQDKLKAVQEGIHEYPWHQKQNLAFWRGATTGGDYSLSNFLDYPRSKCVQLSLENTTLINARFTSLCQTNDAKNIQANFSSFFCKPIPVKAHLLYKYQITLDGNASTYSRLIWQLHSNCLVFKQSSPFQQWFYNSLIPFVHYVPFAWDVSDLKEQLLWAQNHDIEAQQIVKNANLYGAKNFSPQSIYSYLYLVVQKHAQLEKSLQ